MSPVVKKKKERFHLPSKYLLLILTVLCIGLMLLSLTTDIISVPLYKIFGSVITPFQDGISRVGGYLHDRTKELAQIKDLLSENERLSAEVAELTLKNTELEQDRFELNELRKLYELDEEYSGYDKTGARIIASDGGNWFHSFIIDKGTDDGLLVDMNVIADGGLVGRISAIGSDWAKVTTIIEDNSNVSAMILATGDTLITSGSLELMKEGYISYSQLVDFDDKVTSGDKIVTSNISDKYLPGILIGYVSTTDADANNLSKSGLLTPAVDFRHLSEVLVIKSLKQQIEK